MTTRESTNPLRPYYIPPPPVPIGNAAASPSPPPPTNTSSPAYYDMLPDLHDYSDYLETPSTRELLRSFLDQAILSYTSILLSQPFEVAKTVLQCQAVPHKDVQKTPQKRWEEEQYGAQFDDSASESDDEPRYFSSNISPGNSPQLHPTTPAVRGQRKITDRAGYVLENQKDADIPRPEWQIRRCREGTVSEVLKALWAKEGAFGLWKGQNATFIYSVLLTTVESWMSSFLAAVVALPDIGFGEIADATHPFATLGVTVTASALAAIMLSPLDIIRTRLIITPRTSTPRHVLPALRTLPSYTIPPSLIVPTVLYSTLPNIISLGFPVLFKTRFNLNPDLHPGSFNFFSFLAQSARLFVQLPLETILRRAQVSVTKPERTIVPVGRYAGVSGTAWVVVKEEESSKWAFDGLYRGWRIGMWRNIGVFGLQLLGIQQGNASEF